MPVGQNASSHKDAQFEHATIEQAESPARVLQEIATKCGNKVFLNDQVPSYFNIQCVEMNIL